VDLLKKLDAATTVDSSLKTKPYEDLKMFDDKRFSTHRKYKNIPEIIKTMLHENRAKIDCIQISMFDDSNLEKNFSSSFFTIVITISMDDSMDIRPDIDALDDWAWRIYDMSQKIFDATVDGIFSGVDQSKIITIHNGVWNSTFHCLIIPFENGYSEFKKYVADKSRNHILSLMYRPKNPNILTEINNLWHDDEFHVYCSGEFLICPYATCSSRKTEYIEGISECLERFSIFLLVTEQLQIKCQNLLNQLNNSIDIILNDFKSDNKETIIKSHNMEKMNVERLSAIRYIMNYTRTISTLDDEIMKTSWISIRHLTRAIKNDLNFNKKIEVLENEINDAQTAAETIFQVFTSQMNDLTNRAINYLQYLFVTLTTISIIIPLLFSLPLYQTEYKMTYVMMSVISIFIIEVLFISFTFILINNWKYSHSKYGVLKKLHRLGWPKTKNCLENKPN